MEACRGIGGQTGSHLQNESQREMYIDRRRRENVLQQHSFSRLYQPVPQMFINNTRNNFPHGVHTFSTFPYLAYPMQEEPLDLSLKAAPPDEPLDLTVNRSSADELEGPGLPSLKGAPGPPSQSTSSSTSGVPEIDRTANVCSVSTDVNSSVSDVTQQQAFHQNEEAGVSTQCGADSEIHKKQTNHAENLELSKSLLCCVCSKTFVSQLSLKSHMSLHLKDKSQVGSTVRKSLPLRECNDPPRRRQRQGGLKRHVCPVCNKSFSHKSSLSVHSSVHTGLKPYSCKQCGKSFADKSNLSVHMLTHSGLKPHSCKECGKSFAHKSNLSKHMLTHSGLKPHSCNECGKSFADKSNLSKHMLTHSGLKPHSCEDCGTSFAQKIDLTRHMLTHSGLKPHCCKVCGKSFAWTSALSRHRLTHSGLKPHSCKQCGKSFTRTSALSRHMLSHSGLKSRSSK